MFRTLIAKIAVTTAVTAAALGAFGATTALADTATVEHTSVVASDSGSDSDPWD